ncbi:hypothetical protein AK830_g11090 [Neonectria ditissima]|uniref:Uncharacterized protein n=1 Tax=Neonectria ditissima TaxID=78410 RepID=A0A0P7B450_9HYPO|nr:hypothetical protein AK830_g11090 [Neonectria ditissima]
MESEGPGDFPDPGSAQLNTHHPRTAKRDARTSRPEELLARPAYGSRQMRTRGHQAEERARRPDSGMRSRWPADALWWWCKQGPKRRRQRRPSQDEEEEDEETEEAHGRNFCFFFPLVALRAGAYDRPVEA